jgi:hypothetical protein
MSVFKRCDSEPGSFASGGGGVEEEEDADDDDERRAVVACIARKGDMRSAPVRARVFSEVLEMRDV